MMDSDNGVTVERGNCVIEETPPVEGLGLNLNKENSKVDNGVVAVLQVNGVSEYLSNVDGLNSSAIEVETSAIVSETKSSNPPKKPELDHGDRLKSSKTPKDQKANQKGLTIFPRNPRPSLSQSHSFSSRRVPTNDLKKSINGKPVKTDSKHSQDNGSESEAPASSQFNHLNRRASTRVTTSMDANSNGGVGPTARRASSVSVPSIQRSVPGKSRYVNAAVDGPPSEISQSHDPNSKPTGQSLSIKDDEDTRSITSSASGLRRSGGSEFAFRLDERAEKRKEFFSKLEEKTQAKELEKNNLQAKSKEIQEADIKQLRKSLTFKATPMPSFYKEPPPPKVELKKVPTTRAISPKLGRHKISVTVANNSSEGAGSCRSPCPSLSINLSKSNSSNGDSVALKKPLQRPLSKLPSQKSATTKTQTMPLNSKLKTRDPEHENHKALREETENQNKSVENNPSAETEARTELDSVKDSVGNVETTLDSPIPADEAAVEG